MYSIENNIKRISKKAKDASRPVLVFISIPMRGREAEDIRNHVDFIKRLLTKAFAGDVIEIINPVDISDSKPNILSPIEMLGNSISKMSEADVVIFATGWENASGCKVEKTVSFEYKIPWIFENDLIGLDRSNKLNKEE